LRAAPVFSKNFEMKKNTPIFLIILVAVLVLCCCSILILGGVYYSLSGLAKTLPTLVANPFNLPVESTPTPFEITRQSADKIPSETLKLLKGISLPENDPAALACLFRDACNVLPTIPAPTVPYKEGAKQTFWVNSEDTKSYFQVQATLRYITPHSYFWVDDNASYDQNDIRHLMDAFENKIYPTDRQFFGTEWNPGVDGDPHLYIVYAQNLGSTVGGYYSQADEYNPAVRQYSNAHEMFFINAAEQLSNSYTYGTLAHEFQHMIHWYQDRNETTFLNEGLSELAQFINGYPSGGNEFIFISNPDINLTDWIAGTAGDNAAHYGASFLFFDYFLDRFGEDVTKAIVHNQLNGLDSLDDTLAQRKIQDPLTGNVITADDFFMDWAITNFIQDSSIGDGRYAYHNYPQAPKARTTETVSTCPADTATRTVNQYGVDYIRFTCPGNYTLHFEGATSTPLLPVSPHSGTHAFWSNKGDQSDMTLTQTFDLTGVSGPANLDYWTWYDIEKDFDYVFLEASSDGQHWEILKTPSGTISNPNGNSYGWGYTGKSNGWIQESVDLSRFAGKKISVRFEYLTDPGANGEGFLVDDISIPEINYFTDFETTAGSWQASGFARIENSIPQTFRLGLILHTTSGIKVQMIPLTADQSGDIPLTIGENGIKEAILVITGTTRLTRIMAQYQFSIH
jgi:immune inhibitor A